MKEASHVLVLCFDAILADLLEQVLRENGYDVTRVRTLEEALPTPRLRPADLVIVDVDRWIEGEVGSMLETLRSDPTAHGAPILVLAHATDAYDARRLLALHPNVKAMVFKPFDLDTLERETRELLG